MSPTGKALFQQAAALPENERLALVERIMETLPPAADDLTDEEWEAELERRRAEFDRGDAEPVSWEQLKKELLAELDDHDLPSSGEDRSSPRI